MSGPGFFHQPYEIYQKQSSTTHPPSLDILSFQHVLKDTFWKFASDKWQTVEINQDNIKALALEAASEFLAIQES